MNDITTAAYSGHLDLSRFITVGLDDVRIGDEVIANVRVADVLSELAKLKPSSVPYNGKPQRLEPVNGKPSDKISRRVSGCSCPFSLHCRRVVYHHGPICPLLLGAAQRR